MLGQPRLRRRRAARADELPELRQPGEAAHRVAAHARDRRPGRCLPRVRDPGRRRQRLALQRGRRRPDLPDAGRRPRRRAARRARAPAGSGSSPRATRSRSSRAGWAPSLRSLRALQAARRGGRRAAAGGRPRRGQGAARRDPPGRPRRARCTPRTTSPRAASRSRWPSPAWPRARRDGLGPRREAELFGEGPGAFLVSGPASALGAFGAAARVIGTVGGDALTIEGVLERAARRVRPRVHLRAGRPAPLNGIGRSRACVLAGHEPHADAAPRPTSPASAATRCSSPTGARARPRTCCWRARARARRRARRPHRRRGTQAARVRAPPRRRRPRAADAPPVMAELRSACSPPRRTIRGAGSAAPRCSRSTA